MNKQQVWEKIKEREYEIPFKEEVFSLIEQNLSRVQFIKDHIGLRDVLFFSEVGTEKFFSSTLFVALDVETEKNKSMEQNEEAFYKKYKDEPTKVMEELTHFFAHTERILYIGIGFIETTNPELRNKKVPVMTESGSEEIPLYDFLIMKGVQEGKASSYAEMSKLLRKFPEWYEEYATMPEEEDILTVKEEKIGKQELMKLIDQALDQRDEQAFYALSQKYISFIKQKSAH